MPITYTIDVPMALIITRCIGPVTVDEVQQHFEQLARAWPSVERLDVLLDLTEQTSLPALEDLEAVARGLDSQIGSRQFGRCAVVTDQDLLHHSMRMFEVIASRLFDRIEIFPTAFDALVWLNPSLKASRLLTPH